MGVFVNPNQNGWEVYRIPCMEVQQLGNWSPAKGEPPLSIGEAIQACRREKRDVLPDGTELPIVAVRLGYSQQVSLPAVWFYYILYGEHDPDSSAYLSAQQCVVVMDGEVLNPTTLTEQEFENRKMCAEPRPCTKPRK